MTRGSWHLFAVLAFEPTWFSKILQHCTVLPQKAFLHHQKTWKYLLFLLRCKKRGWIKDASGERRDLRQLRSTWNQCENTLPKKRA